LVAHIRAVDSLRFGALWAIGSTMLRYSAIRRVQHVLPPSGKSPAVHTAMVARLPESITTTLNEVITELKLRNPAHYYYPTDTMHLTVQNLDHARQRCSNQSEWLTQLRSNIASCQPFVVRAKGLGVSSSTVFVQLFPEDDSISELRQKLANGTSSSGTFRASSKTTAAELFRSRLFRHLAFVNIVRFSGPISLPFVQEVARRHASYFGRFTIKQLEVVLTDKLLSPAGTLTIDRISLGDDRARPLEGAWTGVRRDAASIQSDKQS
jgi:hypothetical protein